MTDAGSKRVERRLAAIFATDVAGYSRLMGQDEVGTLRALTAHREVMDRLITEHGGRIANTAGDGLLAEFPSAVDAVQCAVEVQQALADLNSSVDPDSALHFRIGIHTGDVLIRGADLLGDGVNIAARLEGIAQPGGVCISAAAFEYVRKALRLSFTDLGPQQVKNIAEPVHAFSWAPSQPAPLATSAPIQAKPLPLPDKPSIAVLPFTNMSDDQSQGYFADGIVEDIISALSRVRSFFVIARNSSFTYKGKAVDVRQVGRELGVRYVLEGSIRKAGTRVRITGQLIEATTGHHVWADKFDGSLDDIFDLQDGITESIVGAIEPSLRAVEMERARAKPTESLDAYDLYLRALAEMHTYAQEGFREARLLLQTSLARDPGYAEAWASLADCIGRSGLFGWIDIDEAKRLAGEAAQKAVRADPNNGAVLALAAWTAAVMEGKIEQGAEYANRAMALAPNSASVLTRCSWVYVFNGDSERAITCYSKARRLDPLDPLRATAMTAVGVAHFFARRFDECVQVMNRVVEENPTIMSAWRFLAAAHAHLGQSDLAQPAIAGLLERQPSSTITRTAKTSKFRYPWMVDLYLNGLRAAGLPE